LFPGTAGDEGNWRLPYEVAPDELARDTVLASRYAAFSALLQAFTLGDQAGFDAASARLSRNEGLSDSGLRRAQGEALHTRNWHLQGELLLVHVRPFRWTWVLLALGMLSLYVSGAVASRQPRLGRVCLYSSVALAIAGFGLAIAGFVMRIVVSGRAPVTNMYETTLWVGFGAILLGLPIARLYRSKIIMGCVLAAGFLLYLLADNMPSVLDPAIHPLVPVLRSNYWLTIHVLTVTISYAAFLVAMVLGNFGLWQYLRASTPEVAHQQVAHFAYRAMQLGVFLLTTGIILGGIWADYSWGRFWGWDPKETWSLIAALGYLIVLHGRFTGWIRSFGTLMGAVLGFYGVVMAWYGVNFVLASGLHAYGFSEGGTTVMATYVLLQGAFAGYVAWQVRRRRGLGGVQSA
jgi:cytochrome c-type biogenesis protein CcsB